jgi:Phage capsid protein
MSDSIYVNLAKGFRANFMVLSQQLDSRLRAAVREEQLTGEDDYFDTVGAADGADITTRHGDTEYASVPHGRRKVTPIGWEWAELIDNQDKVRMLGDPQSSYLQLAHAAANRRIDRHIIDCAFAVAYTGKAGATQVTFPAGNQIAYNFGTTPTGLSVKKLIEARRLILGVGDVDPSIPLHIACTQKQIGDLLATTEVTSADYNSVKALVRGEIDTFLGFKFHTTNLIGVDGSSYRRVIAWAQDGILLGTGMDVKVNIDTLPAKRHSTQIRLEMSFGATRMEESKVVEIKCQES